MYVSASAYVVKSCCHVFKPSANTSRRAEIDPEKEWAEKLFGECEDEFFETFGVYDGKVDFWLD